MNLANHLGSAVPQFVRSVPEAREKGSREVSLEIPFTEGTLLPFHFVANLATALKKHNKNKNYEEYNKEIAQLQKCNKNLVFKFNRN